MPKINRSFALIDGANFYYFSKNISPETHLSNFKYRNFVEYKTNTQSIDITYYIGEIIYSKNPHAAKLYAAQQTLLETLMYNKVNIKLGYLLKTGNKYHEKGVDVQIAVDMVEGALTDKYDQFYLFSSDSDLLPAIKIAKEVGKQVIYVAFKGHLSNALTRNCERTIEITKHEIEQFR